MVPQSRPFLIEWEADNVNGHQEIGELKFNGAELELVQLTKDVGTSILASEPVDTHFFDIGEDCKVTLADNAENTNSFDYWRVFAAHTCINLG